MIYNRNTKHTETEFSMKRKTIHLISQAHLDPVWLWNWNDGLSEALTTMQSACDRSDENSDFKFTRSSAITYKWVEEADPRLFGKISELVKAGRWEIAGGWIEQPDCNIPSTESFARHSLYGKRYFKSRFNELVDIGYNVDSFGHSGGFPQILRKAGYSRYVFMRPFDTEYNGELPLLFQWEGLDASRVLTWRIYKSYCQGMFSNCDDLERALRDTVANGFPESFDDTAFFFGIGNHGGGPTKAQIQRIRELMKDETLPEIKFSTLKEFFDTVEKSPAFANLPVVKGELQHHARGCYAAMSQIKAMNRKTENNLLKAEANSFAASLKGFKYPSAIFEDAWWDLLFNQFHDIAAGSSIKSACDDALEQFGGASFLAAEKSSIAAHFLSRKVDTRGTPAGTFFIMNSLPYGGKYFVSFDTQTDPNGRAVNSLIDTDGKLIPIQWMSPAANVFGKHWGKLCAVLDLPPSGYKMFGTSESFASTDDCKFIGTTYSTDTKKPGIASLKSSSAIEALASSVSLQVISDESDTWAHDIKSFDKCIGEPDLISSEMICDGSLVRTEMQSAKWKNSQIFIYYTRYAGINAVQVKVKVNWQEQRAILKLAIPFRMKNPKIVASAPGVPAFRQPDGEEHPCGDWITVQGDIDGKTVTLGLINDSSYSCDCTETTLRQIIVRSAPFNEHDPVKAPADSDYPYQDQGWIEKTFHIMLEETAWENSSVPNAALRLNLRPDYVADSAHAGTEAWENSFLEISENLRFLSLKKAEDSFAAVLRLVNNRPSEQKAFFAMADEKLRHEFSIGAFEIKTFKISGGKVSETGIMEE